jgi:hypothetical protein
LKYNFYQCAHQNITVSTAVEIFTAAAKEEAENVETEREAEYYNAKDEDKSLCFR